MSNIIRALQVNMNNQLIVAEQIRDRCIAEHIDLVLVQEPPTNENGMVVHFETCQQVSGTEGPGAAIIIASNRLKCIKVEQHTSKYVATAKVSLDGREESSVVVVSAYFKYDRPTTDFTEIIRCIAQQQRTLLICADCNGHSLRWHNRDTNARGRIVEEMIDDLDLCILNIPSPTPTYERAQMGSSNIDLTLATANLNGKIRNWAVSDDTDSDHNTLSFELLTSRPTPNENLKDYFNVKKADWQKFQNALALNQLPINGDVHAQAEMLTNIIRSAAAESMPLKKPRENRATLPPWWNTDLAQSKRALNLARRNNSPEYTALRNRHLKLIKSAKMTAWRAYSDGMNTGTWGKAFNWAKKGTEPRKGPSTLKDRNGQFTSNTEETINVLLEAFIPNDSTPSILAVAPDDGRPMTLTTHGEIKEAIWKLKPNKAPGKDGITGGMLRKAWPILADRITDLFNLCLRTVTFPTPWKEARLVIIPKSGKKDRTTTGAYRPISLLPSIGKVLESLIINRLATETSVDSVGEQHGYVCNRSTVTAIKAAYEWVDLCPNRHITGAFLDITGAFDHVRWDPLLEAARNLGASSKVRNLLGSYLKGRTASLEMNGIVQNKVMERGCPQGSRLGPMLWKLAMVGAFCEDPATSKTVAYADDIVVMTGGARIPTVTRRLEKNLDSLIEWSEKFGLTFSTTKCEAMTLKGGKKTPYSIGFGSDPNAERIEGKDTVKYLGIVIDPRRSFWDHIVSMSEKSTNMYQRLRRMTSANWGVSQTTAMVIYKAVFLPRITYAAEIWLKGLELKKTINKLGSIQRSALKATTGAYNTASTAALQVIAGLMPLDLEIKRHCAKMDLKNGRSTPDEYDAKISELLDVWQDRWNPTQGNPRTGEWTRCLIPCVRTRYGLPMKINHYLSQMLTGHGDFYGKLHSFKLAPRPNCRCGNGSETVQHVLLACTRTTEQRTELRRVVEEEGGTWPPYNGTIIKTRKIYAAYDKFAHDSLKNRTDR